MKDLAIAYAMRKRAMKKGMGLEKPSDSMKEKMPELMSRGGIAKAIMEKRMAAGGIVEDDDFLSDEMSDHDAMQAMDELGNMHMPDEQEEREEEPHVKRKQMLSSIMAGLHSKHYGK